MGDNFFTSKAFLNILRIVGIIISLGMAAASILIFIFGGVKVNPFAILASIFLIFFCLLAVVAELKVVFVVQWFRFLAPFIGFGIYYIFVGTFLILRGSWISWMCGGIGIGLGVIYIIVGAFGVKRMDTSDEAKREQQDHAVKYASNKAQEQNTAENRQALSTAAQSEAGKQQNPFDNDNPFHGGNAY